MFSLVRRHLAGPAALAAILAPLCMLVEVLADLQQPRLMATIIDQGVATGDLSHILRTGGQMIAFAFLGVLGGALCSILSSLAATRLARGLRSSLFTHIQRLSFAEIDTLKTPSLITRMTNDVARMQQMLEMTLRGMTRAPLLCVGGIIMAFLLSSRLALILCVSIPLLALLVFLIIKRALPLFGRIQAELDTVNTVVRENLLGIRAVKAFTMEPNRFGRFGTVNKALADVGIEAHTTIMLLMPVMTLVMNLSVVAVLWYGGKMAVVGGISAGKIMAFVNYLVQIANALVMMAGTLVFISRAAVSGERIQEVLDTRPGIREPEHPRLPQGNDISFDQVNFCYEDACVLKDISLRIPAGSRVGIIGSTGSGKTTLVSLIGRLYDVTSGHVSIGGVDVRDIPLAELRRRVGVVPQESLLFSGTVADNLRYGREDADEAALWAVAGHAQAEDFLARLPEQLEGRVEQRGRNLSGGQRQRLAIARTLLLQPDILILDDAASALDVATEARLRRALTDSIGEATLIIITQRVAAIMDCDTILVLDGGRIVARGSHDELLENNEIYQAIARIQLGLEAS